MKKLLAIVLALVVGFAAFAETTYCGGIRYHVKNEQIGELDYYVLPDQESCYFLSMYLNCKCVLVEEVLDNKVINPEVANLGNSYCYCDNLIIFNYVNTNDTITTRIYTMR